MIHKYLLERNGFVCSPIPLSGIPFVSTIGVCIELIECHIKFRMSVQSSSKGLQLTSR